MKLKFYISGDEKKYTLKSSVSGKETKQAHYKFIKLKDQPNTKTKSSG